LLLGRYPLPIALTVSAAAAIALERLRSSYRVASDTALALVLYVALGAAVVIISLGPGFNVNLFSYLFGNIVTAGATDIWATAGLGIAVLITVWLLYTELVQTTFDPILARVSGVPVVRTNLLLAILTGVTVTLSMRVVGALLVGALIVFPTVASMQLGLGFRATLAVAAAFGALSVLTGLVIAFYQNVGAGGVITLVAIAILGIVSAVRWAFLRLATHSPTRNGSQRTR
jgi:zinc transport system permease protein